MSHLNYKDHYKILQEAVNIDMSPKKNIKIVCGDGVYLTDVSHLKFASKFWIKMLVDIPEGADYVLLAPDISVQNIQHIGAVPTRQNCNDFNYFIISEHCQ